MKWSQYSHHPALSQRGWLCAIGEEGGSQACDCPVQLASPWIKQSNLTPTGKRGHNVIWAHEKRTSLESATVQGTLQN